MIIHQALLQEYKGGIYFTAACVFEICRGPLGTLST